MSDNKDFENLLGEFNAKSEPFVCNVSFGISAIDGEGILLSIEDKSLIESEFFDGSLLRDNITEEKTIPTKPGFYIGKIRIHSFQCNRPDDPIEWDEIISLEEVQLIVYDSKNTKFKGEPVIDESKVILREPINDFGKTIYDPNYHVVTRSEYMMWKSFHGLNE